jgi:hypothetical protein
VLLVALGVSRTCASNRGDITQDEAIQIAIDNASFVPCRQEICRQVRFIQRGVPPVGFWAVVLSERVDAQNRPNRTETFLINASTGDVSRV